MTLLLLLQKKKKKKHSRVVCSPEATPTESPCYEPRCSTTSHNCIWTLPSNWLPGQARSLNNCQLARSQNPIWKDKKKERARHVIAIKRTYFFLNLRIFWICRMQNKVKRIEMASSGLIPYVPIHLCFYLTVCHFPRLKPLPRLLGLLLSCCCRRHRRPCRISGD